jgi:hypothetical protein
VGDACSEEGNGSAEWGEEYGRGGREDDLESNRDNRAITERHNGGIMRERNPEGSVGIPCLQTAEETTYIAFDFVRRSRT